MTITATQPSDLDDLLGLWNNGTVMQSVGFPEGLGMDAEKMQGWYDKLQANPHSHHYVVRAAALGFCGELFYRHYPEQRLASLDIKLLPTAQGRGIGSYGLRWLIDTVFSHETEIDSLFVEPNDGNQAAMKLYRRCGLQPSPRPDFLHPADSYWALRRADWQVPSHE